MGFNSGFKGLNGGVKNSNNFDIFAHHQKHLNCNYSIWFHSHVLLSAAVVPEWELTYVYCIDCIGRYFCSSSGAF